MEFKSENKRIRILQKFIVVTIAVTIVLFVAQLIDDYLNTGKTSSLN